MLFLLAVFRLNKKQTSSEWLESSILQRLPWPLVTVLMMSQWFWPPMLVLVSLEKKANKPQEVPITPLDNSSSLKRSSFTMAERHTGETLTSSCTTSIRTSSMSSLSSSSVLIVPSQDSHSMTRLFTSCTTLQWRLHRSCGSWRTTLSMRSMKHTTKKSS